MGHDPNLARTSAARPPVMHAMNTFRDARHVASSLEPDAPLMLFSPGALSRQFEVLRTAFRGDVCFAVKANSAPEVLATLVTAGIGCFDVASLAEIEAVRRAAPTARINYHNPVKSSREIASAYRDHGVRRFAADDVNEVSKILAVTGDDPAVEIAVRFRLPNRGAAVHEFSKKFGCDPAGAADLLRLVSARGLKAILTFHPGSQCRDPEAYSRYIGAAAAIAKAARVPLSVLNTGGGLPVPYKGMDVPSLETFAAAIAAAAAHAFAGDHVPRLECEPGRALAAPSTSLLSRVKLVKAGAIEVFLNDGIYGALKEFAQVPALCPPYRAFRTGGHLEPGTAEFVAFGPTCDPLDRLPLPLTLPANIAAGDYIEFGQLGAYGAVTSTRFNGYGHAETVFAESVFGIESNARV